MSRTYKKYPHHMMRRMRGYKQAKSRELVREERDDGIPAERKGSIPPNPWDDLRHDNHCYLPFRAAENMKDHGILREEAINKIKRKFKLSYAEAEEATSWIYKRWPRGW